MFFNSYYNGVGNKHPRAQRGLLTRPGMRVVRDYRANVDHRIADLLAGGIDETLATLIELGLQHEQEHPMRMITAIIRPHRYEAVREALTKLGVSGVTATQVQGFGRQHRRDARHADRTGPAA